jgi:hypothetical protein
MKAKVSEEGVLIPRQWLDGAAEVELLRENGRITVVPLFGPDPILKLGQNPVTIDVDDGSANHDRYLYS